MTVGVEGYAASAPALQRRLESVVAPLRAQGLSAVLLGAVSLARDLLGCDYAAVAMTTPDGRLQHLVPVGTEFGPPDRIGRVPREARVLATASTAGDADVVRRDRAEDPALADDLPGARALLAVPVVVDGRSSGVLYLIRRDGSDDAFTPGDQQIAEVVAGVVADEVERDHETVAGHGSESWYEAAVALAREIGSGRRPAPLPFAAEQIRLITDADVVVMMQERGTAMTVTAAAGRAAEQWLGFEVDTADSLAAEVLGGGRALTVARSPGRSATPYIGRGATLSSVVVAPVAPELAEAAVVVIGRDGSHPPFSSLETGMTEMLAGQVAMALDLAAMHSRRDQTRLLRERDRIARDLHDHVIQRLFALGMSLQSASMQLPDAVAERLQTGVDEIDDTIRQIRATIYHLTGPLTSESASVRMRAARLIEELEPTLGFRPELVVTGPVDLAVCDDGVIADCAAVLREALTNVARHAGASAAQVSLSMSGDDFTVEISDNGRGIGPTTRRSGLANMRARAQQRGGRLDVRDNDPHGTVLRWTIRIDDEAPARSD